MGFASFQTNTRFVKKKRQCGSKAIVLTCRVDFLGQIESFMNLRSQSDARKPGLCFLQALFESQLQQTSNTPENDVQALRRVTLPSK
jgi:hypothetical protein